MRARKVVVGFLLAICAACAPAERTAGTGDEKRPASPAVQTGEITATSTTDSDLAVIDGALTQIDAELQGIDEALKTNVEDVEQ